MGDSLLYVHEELEKKNIKLNEQEGKLKNVKSDIYLLIQKNLERNVNDY